MPDRTTGVSLAKSDRMRCRRSCCNDYCNSRWFPPVWKGNRRVDIQHRSIGRQAVRQVLLGEPNAVPRCACEDHHQVVPSPGQGSVHLARVMGRREVPDRGHGPSATRRHTSRTLSRNGASGRRPVVVHELRRASQSPSVPSGNGSYDLPHLQIRSRPSRSPHQHTHPNCRAGEPTTRA